MAREAEQIKGLEEVVRQVSTERAEEKQSLRSKKSKKDREKREEKLEGNSKI